MTDQEMDMWHDWNEGQTQRERVVQLLTDSKKEGRILRDMQAKILEKRNERS